MKSMSFSWLRLKKNRKYCIWNIFRTENDGKKLRNGNKKLHRIEGFETRHTFKWAIDISVDWATFRNKCVFSQLKRTFQRTVKFQIMQCNAMRYAQNLDFIWHWTIFVGVRWQTIQPVCKVRKTGASFQFHYSVSRWICKCKLCKWKPLL